MPVRRPWSDPSRFRDHRPLERRLRAERPNIKVPEYHDPHSQGPPPEPYDPFRPFGGGYAYEVLAGPEYRPPEHADMPDPVREPPAPRRPGAVSPPEAAGHTPEYGDAVLTQDFFNQLMQHASAMAAGQPVGDGGVAEPAALDAQHAVDAEGVPAPPMEAGPFDSADYEGMMMDQELFDRQMREIDPFDMPDPPGGW